VIGRRILGRLCDRRSLSGFRLLCLIKRRSRTSPWPERCERTHAFEAGAYLGAKQLLHKVARSKTMRVNPLGRKKFIRACAQATVIDTI